jgi:predicted transglutaminase-like cysteine proteinase
VPKRWNDLVHVNKLVNAKIKPLTDLEHWGVVERWSYPDDGYGECEDYVLLKRRMLIQSGWPWEVLLITVVRGNKNEGHAVLTVITDKGDYVLDNPVVDRRRADRVILASLHLLTAGFSTRPPCRDGRYNAALGGLAELIWMRCGRRN